MTEPSTRSAHRRPLPSGSILLEAKPKCKQWLLLVVMATMVRTSSPYSIAAAMQSIMGRRLLQSVGDLTLSLCETNVCEAQRPDGVCDRWSLGNQCPERQVYHVRGDPGTNEKSEMFFNLRSPWNVTCQYGRCTPSEGAVYDVFIAENCIPEDGYISEMQDTSNRVSKQAKIYLRRNTQFYITVQRKANMFGASNCSYGITTGSIEAADDSAKCTDFRRVSDADIAAANIPFCRDTMPDYQDFQQSDVSAQSTFIVALIGVGILTLALLVLASVLWRRWRRSKSEDLKDVLLDGLQPGDGAATHATDVTGVPDSTGQEIQPAAGPGEPSQALEPGWGGAKDGDFSKSKATAIVKSSAQFQDDDSDDGAEIGAGAGVLDAPEDSNILRKKGSGGGLILAGGKKRGDGSGTSTPRPGTRTPSPADELYRSRITAKGYPGSPGHSRGPTPPLTGRPPSGRSLPSSAGDVDDLDLKMGGRETSSSHSSRGQPEWEDQTGIRIDDILEQAKAAGRMQPPKDSLSDKGSQRSLDKGRAWKPGSAGSGSGSGPRSDASITDEKTKEHVSSGSPGSGSDDKNKDLAKEEALGTTKGPSPPPPPPAKGSMEQGRPKRPVVAPLMAARLGLAAGGARSNAGRQMQSIKPGEQGAATTSTSKVVALAPLQSMPRAGQAGVPPPPPRPTNGDATRPPISHGSAGSPSGSRGSPPVGSPSRHTPPASLAANIAARAGATASMSTTSPQGSAVRVVARAQPQNTDSNGSGQRLPLGSTNGGTGNGRPPMGSTTRAAARDGRAIRTLGSNQPGESGSSNSGGSPAEA